MFKPSSDYFVDRSKAVFLLYNLSISFCYLCFMFIVTMLSCLFLAAVCSSNRKGLTYWLSCVLCFLVFLSFSHVVFQARYGT